MEVKIVKESLSATERKEFDDGWQRNAFNQYISDRMSLHRALLDVRDAESVSFAVSFSPLIFSANAKGVILSLNYLLCLFFKPKISLFLTRLCSWSYLCFRKLQIHLPRYKTAELVLNVWY